MKRVFVVAGGVVVVTILGLSLISCSTLQKNDAEQIYLRHWGIADQSKPETK